MKGQLSQILKKMKTKTVEKDDYEAEVKDLQLKMLRIQQGVFHRKDRVIIVFEGFDAAGKGGTIRKLTEVLDPRSIRVVPIGAPKKEEQGIHWLYRFWSNLPTPGMITVFDRSWYGRVLVEKVDELAPKERIKEAYDEINEFEAQLQNDGITVIKIFLAISKDEQLKRFEDRLNDPYKQWKITIDDVRARKKWNDYVKATDELLEKTDLKSCPWHLIDSNSKKIARFRALSIVTKKLKFWCDWMEDAALAYDKTEIRRMLKKI